MKKKKPFFSIIVPVLNAVETIQKTIESVLIGNSTASYELIIFDGISSDGTIEILNNYKDSIDFLKISHDSGPHNSINNALKIASGEVIVILCADDCLESNILNSVEEKFREDSELELLTCGIRIYDVNGKILKSYIKDKDLDFCFRNIIKTPLSHGRFIRKELYQRVGGFPEKFKLCNDLYFLLKIFFSKEIKSKTLELNSYNYLKHSKSSTMGNDPYKKFDTYLDNYLIALLYLEKYKYKLNFFEKFSLYSLFYKSYLKMMFYKVILKGLNFHVQRPKVKIIIEGVPYIPLIVIEYLIEKVKL